MAEQADVESTPLADERTHPRYQGRLDAELLVDGERWRCWIRDISLGGAGLEPPIPAALGRDVVLVSAPLGTELPGRVVNLAHRRTCVAFALAADSRTRLAAFLTANATG